MILRERHYVLKASDTITPKAYATSQEKQQKGKGSKPPSQTPKALRKAKTEQKNRKTENEITDKISTMKR